MLIKNGKHYYEEADLREYGRGYWDGRFNGYSTTADMRGFEFHSYTLGFQHGEADYNAFDAYVEEPIAFDDLDVVEQIRNHPLD